VTNRLLRLQPSDLRPSLVEKLAFLLRRLLMDQGDVTGALPVLVDLTSALPVLLTFLKSPKKTNVLVEFVQRHRVSAWKRLIMAEAQDEERVRTPSFFDGLHLLGRRRVGAIAIGRDTVSPEKLDHLYLLSCPTERKRSALDEANQLFATPLAPFVLQLLPLAPEAQEPTAQPHHERDGRRHIGGCLSGIHAGESRNHPRTNPCRWPLTSVGWPRQQQWGGTAGAARPRHRRD
jgi:hypothetical protein